MVQYCKLHSLDAMFRNNRWKFFGEFHFGNKRTHTLLQVHHKLNYLIDAIEMIKFVYNRMRFWAHRLHHQIGNGSVPFRWKPLPAFLLSRNQSINSIQIRFAFLSYSFQCALSTSDALVPFNGEFAHLLFCDISNWLAFAAIPRKFNSHYAHLHIDWPLCDRFFPNTHTHNLVVFCFSSIVLSEIERTMIDDGRKVVRAKNQTHTDAPKFILFPEQNGKNQHFCNSCWVNLNAVDIS